MRDEVLDEQILKEVDSVDWHNVSEADAAGFGLAVGFFRDSNHLCQLRRAAMGAALGGVLSMSVLASFGLLMGASAGFILGLIIVHQLVRTTILWWKSRQAFKMHGEIEQQAIQAARELASKHPAKEEEVAA